MTRFRTATLTLLALLAFAANSLCCRVALGRGLIDPGSFTSLRLAAGAIMLLLLLSASNRGRITVKGSWTSSLLLAAYASTFSYGYVSLSVGSGALVLFAGVQSTMVAAALLAGERPNALRWVGIAAAISGLVYLVFPGLEAPSPIGAALMACAGIAWGVYSLRGSGTSQPLLETAGNFLRAIPFVFAVSLVTIPTDRLTWPGVILAVFSGAVASGIGYVIWYAALRGLTTIQAATTQLLVPVLAAVGGVIVLSEDLSFRFALASSLILGGVAVGLGGRVSHRFKRRT